MIALSEARKLLSHAEEPVEIEVFTQSGELIKGLVTSTSSYFQGNTFNIRFHPSGEIRKIRAVLIISINNQKVYL